MAYRKLSSFEIKFLNQSKKIKGNFIRFNETPLIKLNLNLLTG